MSSDEDFDYDCLRYATEVIGGLEFLRRARVNASERLSGTYEALPLSSGAVLCKDACIWPLLAMGRLAPQCHKFSGCVDEQWAKIFFAVIELLEAEVQAMQGSVTELRTRIRYAIYAHICKSSVAENSFIGPFTYNVNTFHQHVGGRDEYDADILWRFMDPDDTKLGGCLTLLIDSLIEAGPHCLYKTTEYMEIGGVHRANCSICLEVDQEALSLPCGHCFDRDCLMTWFDYESFSARRRTCPICRTRFADWPPAILFGFENDLSRLVTQDLRYIYWPLEDTRQFASDSLIRYRNRAIQRMLQSEERYTMSIDNCLFSLIAMSERCKIGVQLDQTGLQMKKWNVMISTMFYLLRTTFYGRQGTASQLGKALRLEIYELLQSAYEKAQTSLPGPAKATLHSAGPPKTWQFF